MSDRPPILSVITVTLNAARFLRETLDSVVRQTFTDYEHIVVDGGSTDGTQAILAQYPSIRWVSEPDGDLGFVGAIRKAADMARGKYVIQCFISDGFLDVTWFSRAVTYMEAHPECGLVWSLPQQMAEDGALLGLFHGELLEQPPANGTAFLPFWLASQFVFPEGNYCTYTTILRECFPGLGSPAHHLIQPHPAFVYNFMRRGYLAAMIPLVSSYFRTHEGQRYQARLAIELPAARQYQKDVVRLWWAIVLGTEEYVFRRPDASPLARISPADRVRLSCAATVQWILRLKVLRYPPIRVFRYLRRAVLRERAA
jgi:glycosyltransferase involved in cell wall biosynthesis